MSLPLKPKKSKRKPKPKTAKEQARAERVKTAQGVLDYWREALRLGDVESHPRSEVARRRREVICGRLSDGYTVKDLRLVADLAASPRGEWLRNRGMSSAERLYAPAAFGARLSEANAWRGNRGPQGGAGEYIPTPDHEFGANWTRPGGAS